MVETRASLERTFPLPAYSFRVDLDGVAMSFTEVSGIAVKAEAVTYRHGLSFLEGEEIATFADDRFIPLTLRRGIVLGSGPLLLYQWLKQRDSRGLEISLLTASGVPAISWRIARAVPVKLEVPSFQASTQDAAITSLELMARGISMVEHQAARR